jgi:hypothetical protein
MTTNQPASLIPVDLRDPVTGALPTSIVGTGRLTPPQIATAYGIPASDGAGIKVGIIAPGGGGFLQSDLDKSFNDLRNAGLIGMGVATPTIHQVLLDGVDGSFAGNLNSSGENTVDIFCVAAVVPAATITIYIGNSFESPLNRAIADGCDILTISWITSESTFLESIFATAAANKVSICVASGDWGSTFPGQSTLQPCYPSSSPQVISIGGTKLILNTNNTRASETDDNRDPSFGPTWGGGGGVSAIFNLPSWQSGLHYTPITNGTTGSSRALTMRGLPDISAPMNVYGVWFNGQASGFGGTSLSSPTMAGILARMQKLTGIKRSSAEYNRLFYANPTAFHDITVGTNNTQITSGYAGTADWDPVTGLGPPTGQPMLDILSPPVASTVVPSVSVTPLLVTSPVTVVTATGGLPPYTWTLNRSLPTGLTFSTAGQITGTATVESALSTYTATVTDSQNLTSSTTFTLASVAIPLSAVVNTSRISIHPYVSTTNIVPVSASGGNGNKTYGISPTLPGSLTFNSATGNINAGTVTTLFTTTYTVSIVDQLSKTTSANFVLSSTLIPLEVASTQDRFKGYPLVPLDVTPLQLTGGTGQITYSINPTGLPFGLSFNASTGAITGIPETVAHSNTYHISARDQFGQTASTEFRLKIKSPLNVIDSDVQNLVYNSLFDIMGTTSTGYGAELIGDPVNPGDRIKADNWDRMIKDVERCLIHQNGTSTNSILMATTGSVATYTTPARMYTTLQYLQKNIGHVDPSQVETYTVNTTALSSEYWTATNTSTLINSFVAGNGYMTAVNWSWFYQNQLKYFFNLGGKMRPNIGIVRSRPRELAGWQPLINAANQVVFGRDQFIQALNSPNKSFTYTITGTGDRAQALRERRMSRLGSVLHKVIVVNKEKDTNIYAANGITVKFTLMQDPGTGEYNQVVGSIQFVAGIGTKKKGKKKFIKEIKLGKNKVLDIFSKKVIGRYIGVTLQVLTDFITTYPNGNNGGIAAQIPQTMLTSNSLSARPAPIPQVTMGLGDTGPVQVFTLTNNTTATVSVTNIFLNGYTDGTVTPTSCVIEPFRSTEVHLQYTGTTVGHHRGTVHIIPDSQLNPRVIPLVLFTEVNVGSTNPRYIDITTSTYDVISKNFVVDHAGGYFKDFTLSTETSTGFSVTNPVPGTDDEFNITFNPRHFTNGTYSTTATVIVNPLDSSQISTVWKVPFTVRLTVDNRHIADWESCTLGDNTRLGVSYDVIGGRTYLTAGIGLGSPNMMELRSDDTEFTSWMEVYRIQLETSTRKVYSKNHCVKSYPSFKYGDYFGVGTAEGSLFTIHYDGKGNLEILLNTVYNVPTQNTAETLDMSTAFRYYDSRRRNQLQSQSSLSQGGQTLVFTGFDAHGETRLSLVAPN